MIKIHGWSGKWPTDEYPPDNTKVRYIHKSGKIKESSILYIWCGTEPVIELQDGNTLFLSFDKFEVIDD